MKEYSTQVFWSPEDEGYVAVCAEFEGISGVGDSREEAVAELETALAMAIDAHRKRQWPLPEAKPLSNFSGQFRVRLPSDLHAKLVIQAENAGISLNSLVISYLSASLAGQVAADIIARRVERHLLDLKLELANWSPTPEESRDTTQTYSTTQDPVLQSLGY